MNAGGRETLPSSAHSAASRNYRTPALGVLKLGERHAHCLSREVIPKVRDLPCSERGEERDLGDLTGLPGLRRLDEDRHFAGRGKPDLEAGIVHGGAMLAGCLRSRWDTVGTRGVSPGTARRCLGTLPSRSSRWPREESNLRAWIRSPPLYPLSYGALTCVHGIL